MTSTIDRIMKRPAVVWKPGPATVDEYGARRPGTWERSAELSVYVEQTTTAEVVVGGDVVQADWQLVAPAGTELAAWDRIEVPDLPAVFEVVGLPNRLRRATSNAEHHVEARLRLVNTSPVLPGPAPAPDTGLVTALGVVYAADLATIEWGRWPQNMADLVAASAVAEASFYILTDEPPPTSDQAWFTSHRHPEYTDDEGHAIAAWDGSDHLGNPMRVVYVYGMYGGQPAALFGMNLPDTGPVVSGDFTPLRVNDAGDDYEVDPHAPHLTWEYEIVSTGAQNAASGSGSDAPLPVPRATHTRASSA